MNLGALDDTPTLEERPVRVLQHTKEELDELRAQLAEATAAASILRQLAQRFGCDEVARGEHALRGVLYAVESKVNGLANDLVLANDARVDAERRRDELAALVHNPQTGAFLDAVRSEAAHQATRWEREDLAKTDSAWLALVVMLASKAHFNPLERSDDYWAKKLHRIATVGAAAANWYARIQALRARHAETTWTDEEGAPS